jgi:hypothetical protein
MVLNDQITRNDLFDTLAYTSSSDMKSTEQNNKSFDYVHLADILIN